MSPELDPVIDLSSDSEEEQPGSCGNHKTNSNLDLLKQKEDQNVEAKAISLSCAFVFFHLESLRFSTSPKLYLTQVDLKQRSTKHTFCLFLVGGNLIFSHY